MKNNTIPDYGFILENLMDTLSDAVYFKDRDSRFILINKACAAKHRWKSSDQIKGKTDFDVFSREHAEQAFADEQKIIETGEPLYGIEEKETWTDGSVSWVSTTKMPLRDEDGKIIGTFGISRDITAHKNDELQGIRYAKEINRIKKEMEEDVQMAGELQKTFFPRHYPSYPKGVSEAESCVEFLHHFHLCSEVSGDYCAIFPVSETEAGIFLCDIQGVGLRAALGTALVCGIVQEITPRGITPSTYLERMNQLLMPLLSHDDIPLDIKAFYLILDVTTGTLRYASAGHPLPLHLNQTSAEWLADQKNCGVPLAVDSNVTYQTAEKTIAEGDSVVLYTDGLTSVSNAKGQFFGANRLLESARNHKDKSLKELFEALETDARNFSPEHLFSDDLCLVGFTLKKYLTPTPRADA